MATIFMPPPRARLGPFRSMIFMRLQNQTDWLDWCCLFFPFNMQPSASASACAVAIDHTEEPVSCTIPPKCMRHEDDSL